MINNGINHMQPYNKAANFLIAKSGNREIMARNCLCGLRSPHLFKCLTFTAGFISYLKNHRPDLFQYIGGNDPFIYHLEDDLIGELLRHMGPDSDTIFAF